MIVDYEALLAAYTTMFYHYHVHEDNATVSWRQSVKGPVEFGKLQMFNRHELTYSSKEFGFAVSSVLCRIRSHTAICAIAGRAQMFKCITYHYPHMIHILAALFQIINNRNGPHQSAKDNFEMYARNLGTSVNNSSVSGEDKATVRTHVTAALKWLECNESAVQSKVEARQKQLVDACAAILPNVQPPVDDASKRLNVDAERVASVLFLMTFVPSAANPSIPFSSVATGDERQCPNSWRHCYKEPQTAWYYLFSYMFTTRGFESCEKVFNPSQKVYSPDTFVSEELFWIYSCVAPANTQHHLRIALCSCTRTTKQLFVVQLLERVKRQLTDLQHQRDKIAQIANVFVRNAYSECQSLVTPKHDVAAGAPFAYSACNLPLVPFHWTHYKFGLPKSLQRIVYAIYMTCNRKNIGRDLTGIIVYFVNTVSAWELHDAYWAQQLTLPCIYKWNQ